MSSLGKVRQEIDIKMFVFLYVTERRFYSRVSVKECDRRASSIMELKTSTDLDVILDI